MSSKKRIWIIGIGGTDVDGVILYKVYGDTKQVKQYMLKLVNNDREFTSDEMSWEYGAECIDDIVEDEKHLYTTSVYSTYHIDYQATPLNDMHKYDLTEIEKKGI